MAFNSLNIFKTFFIVGCGIGALVFVIKLIYEYSLNKDSSSLEFRAFHSNTDSVYPSISLCFDLTDIIRNTTEHDETFVEKYREFLSGCERTDGVCNWDASFAKLDYDNITLNLVDYVIGEITEFEDKSQHTYVYRKFPKKGTQVEKKYKEYFGYLGGDRVYTSRRTWEQKCLTLDIPFKKNTKVRYHSILLNNSIFENKRRPKKYDFDVSFHYPHQITRQTSKKYSWTNVSSLLNKTCGDEGECYSYHGSSYTMEFGIDLVTVLERRNTGKHPCIKTSKDDDVALKTKISQEIKCQPSHWKLSSNLTTCENKTQLRTAMDRETNPLLPACKAMERYAFTYAEQSGMGFFSLDLNGFNTTFGIDWNNEEMQEEIVSEIQIHFVGKLAVILHYPDIKLSIFFRLNE